MDMMIKRIYASSIVALLLSVSSLAAACDLSCALASMNSDCHSQQTESQDSAAGGMKMAGMVMAGMTMPDMNHGDGPQTISGIPLANTGHPSIGEMGPCERQSCDSFASVRLARSNATQFYSFLLVTDTRRAIGVPAIFCGARDDLAPFLHRDASPPTLSLRI